LSTLAAERRQQCQTGAANIAGALIAWLVVLGKEAMPKTDTSYQPPVTLSTRPAKLSINQLMGTTLSASVAGGWHDKPSPCTPLQGLPNNKNSDEEVSGLMRPGTPTNCSQAAFWTTKNVSLQYRKQNPSKNSMHVAQEERNARCKIVKGRLDQHRRLNEERQLHSNGHTHTNTNTNPQWESQVVRPFRPLAVLQLSVRISY